MPTTVDRTSGGCAISKCLPCGLRAWGPSAAAAAAATFRFLAAIRPGNSSISLHSGDEGGEGTRGRFCESGGQRSESCTRRGCAQQHLRAERRRC